MNSFHRKSPSKTKKSKRKPSKNKNNSPYLGSDGYWYIWINDGRGGYEQILPLNEQLGLNWEPGR